MNLFFPPDSVAELGITLNINVGSFEDRILAILTNKESFLVTELSDEEYELIRPILIKCGTEFKVVINVPDVPSPRSFLYEEDVDHIISYDKIELRDKSDADKFLEELGEDIESSGGLPEIEDDELDNV